MRQHGPGYSRGLWVLKPGQFSCLPQDNLVPGAKLLVLDELQELPGRLLQRAAPAGLAFGATRV